MYEDPSLPTLDPKTQQNLKFIKRHNKINKYVTDYEKILS